MDTKALRQKILDLAIRGKLVPQDPNDEPASVLLERIRQQKQQMVKEGKLKPKDIKNDSVIFIGEDNLHYEKFADGSMKCIEDEIPFDLPDGWAWAFLSNIVYVLNGDRGQSYPAKSKLRSKGIPFVSASNIQDGVVSSDGLLCLSDSQYDALGAGKLLAGDIVYCIRGSLGKCGLFTMEKGAIASSLVIVRSLFDAPHITDYIFLYLNSALAAGEIKKYDNGSAQPNLAAKDFRHFLVPLPPQAEMQRINKQAREALVFVKRIQNNKDELHAAIAVAKSKILDLAIRGQLVPQDPNDEPASVLLERIRAEKEELIKQGKIKRGKKESVIFRGEDNSYYEKIGNKVENISDEIPFELPDRWAFVRLKELWELISGRDLSPAEYNADGVGIPYITGASNFVDGKVELARWTTSPQVITEAGDLLLTCKGTIGGMAFNDFGSAHIARQIMAIRNTFALNSEYLALCMGFYINAIKGAAKGLIPGISREDILNLILPVPSLNYQAKVAERVAEVANIFSAIEKSLS